MKRLLFVFAVAALALPATSPAKGPSEAKITGPGLDKAIVITGSEDVGSPLMDFAEAAGFFPEAFGQEPSVTTSTRPKSELGPKYEVVYTVPGNDGRSLKQDLYPYASPYGMTHMTRGQGIFDMTTRGGWFTDSRLKTILVAHGLPTTPAEAKSTSSRSAGFFSTGNLGAVVLVLLVLGGAFVLARKRTGGQTA
jgi:hypothetical protein